MQTTLLAQKLKHLAVSHDLAVLVTNYSTTPQQDATSTASAVAPARAGLGSAWSFAPSVQISTVETDLEGTNPPSIFDELTCTLQIRGRNQRVVSPTIDAVASRCTTAVHDH